MTRRGALHASAVRENWRGAWIWTDDAPAARNAYATFRRAFRSAAAGELTVHVSADSFYTLWVDDRLIARGPARSHLGSWSYDTHQLALPAGRHELTVLVHHVGVANAAMMLGRPGLIADVEWRGDDGTLDLSTGPEWLAVRETAWRDTPEPMSHFGFAEDRDLGVRSTGVPPVSPAGVPPARDADILSARDAGLRPAYPEASGGTPAELAGKMPASLGKPPCEPWGPLVARDVPPLRLERVTPTVAVAHGVWTPGNAESDPLPSRRVAARRRTRSERPAALPARLGGAEGRYVTLDFGRTVSGYPILRFADSAAGQAIDVSYDEMLSQTADADAGAVNPERTYAHLTDHYELPGGPVEVRAYHPRGFRYVTIDAAPADGATVLSAVEAEEETYPFVEQGSFHSGDAQLDAFARKAALTVRVCSADAFMDCSTRERVQWTEDLYAHGRAAHFAFGETAMVRRALFQGAQSQLDDGRINGFFPSERTNCAFASSSLMWLMLLPEHWLHAGRADDLAALLPAARRALDAFDAAKGPDGLIADWPAGQFWEWSPLNQGGTLLLTNAFYALAVEGLSRHEAFAALFAADPADMLAALRRTAHEAFWNADRQLYADTTDLESAVYHQAPNAAAVLAGVCPAEARADLMRRIVDPANLGPVPVGESSLHKDDRRGDGGIVPVGTLWFGQWLCRALFEAGLGDEAVAQMRRLWGAYEELPTFPEVRVQGDNTGFCHGWAAGPAFLLPAYVLGIRPTAGGWGRVAFEPTPADVPAARGRFRTPHGELRAAWRRDGEAIELQLDVPDGVTVEVAAGELRQRVAGPVEWHTRVRSEHV